MCGLRVAPGSSCFRVVLVGLLFLPVGAMAQFTCTTNNGTLTITGYSGSAASLAIPAAINGYPVTGIGAGAFLRRSTLTNVLLPDSLVTIGDSAFASCFSLATINFPPNLASIDGGVFNGRKLTSVALPQSITNIGARAFAGCTTLQQITVAALNPSYCDLDGVLFNKSRTTLIQCPAQRSGNYLAPNTVTSIGNASFSGSSLHRIELHWG